MEKECLIIFVFIQSTNNKTGTDQTTGFVDELPIMWSTSKVMGKSLSLEGDYTRRETAVSRNISKTYHYLLMF